MKNRPKAPTWVDVGAGLQEQWLCVLKDFHANARRMVEEHPQFIADAEPFLWAVIQLNRGNPAPVVEYLRSNKPLSSDDRDSLALCLEGGLRRKTKRGRKHSASTEAAEIAEKFYREWKQTNRIRGIKDRGHSSEMRQESGRFVVEDYVPGLGAKLKTTLELLDVADT